MIGTPQVKVSSHLCFPHRKRKEKIADFNHHATYKLGR
jgi:hypothetical protein